MLPVVVGLVAFGLIVVLALTFGRRRGDIQTRSGVDGFWISTRGLRAGSRIRYGCLVPTGRHYGTVVVEPGPDEIFVYTGNTPTDVSLEVLAFSDTSRDDDDDDDAGVISAGMGGTFSSGSDGSYSSGTDAGSSSSGSTGDYGSSSASAESSASDAGNGFPPAY